MMPAILIHASSTVGALATKKDGFCFPRRPGTGWRSWTVLALWPVILTVAVPSHGAAPRDRIYELSAKDLREADLGVTLPTVFRFHPGDDPVFAALNLDDGAWPEVDTRLLAQEMPPDWDGLGWFRLRFRVGAGLRGVPLGLLVQQVGAAEVYLDGELLVSLGKADADPAMARAVYQRQPHVFTFDDAMEHVLAVRFCNHEPQAYESVGRFGGFQVVVGEANGGVTSYSRELANFRSYQALFSGVFASFALLHLLLYAFYRESTENLYFSLLSAAVGLLVYLFLHNLFTTDPHYFQIYGRAMNTTWLLLCVFALRFVYAVFYPALPRLFLVALGAVLVLVVPGWLWPLATEPWVLVLTLLVSVEMVRTVAVALAKRKAGARIVGSGILTLAVGISVGLLANLGVVTASVTTTVFIPFGSMFFLMLAMSIYLSRKFAHTHRELRQQLLQVQELSEARLEQERRVREHEVHRARLEAEYQRKVQELEEARHLQLSMLPERLPELPDLEVAAGMHTATEVGGDYYDFDLAPDGTLTIAVGDATGHGMKAGAMVTATKSLFNALGHETDLSGTLTRFTHALKRMNLRQLTMALTLAKFKSGNLRLAAAGMPPPLIFRAASGDVESLDVVGMPLGSLAGFPYHESQVHLEPGDTVLFMSDGFPERLNHEQEMLGYENARRAFSQNASTSPRAIIEGLVAEGDAWANGHPAQDDMTFVVLKMREV